jgi:DeoR/GlpR family transcriptional regulator of sugar metabolism
VQYNNAFANDPLSGKNMNTRQQALLQLVTERQRVSVTDLSKALGVSVVTIRQDLNQLETAYFLKRVHGFAVALESDDVDARMMSNFGSKTALALHAASLVKEDETVFIEGGSSNALLARELGKRKNQTLITVSSYIAHLLKESECEVILLGGIYQKKSDSLVGPLTRRCLDLVHFSKAFIGIDGYHPDTGFTSRDMMRADIANAVLAKEAEHLVLSDSSKFGQIHPNPIGPGSAISRIITDDSLDPDIKKMLGKQGFSVDVVASE